ncbi:MAG: MFS transporter [Actinomycetota bacterium]
MFSRRDPAHPSAALARAFVRWSFLRSALWRGYWLLAGVYLVVVAGLSASQLVLVGAVQSATVFAAELPAGLLADTRSRRTSLVIAHVATGAGMVMAGLVTSFPALAASQALCGLGWAFASGADVAWISDELGEPDAVPRVLAVRARWDLIGAAVGLLGLGGVGAAAGLSAGIVTSGVLMIGLAGVVGRFPERRFVPVDGRRARAGWRVLRRAVVLAAGDRDIRLVAAAWLLINGSADAYGRLVDQRLLGLGFGEGERPIVWFTALGLVLLAVGALTLRAVEARVHDDAVAVRAIVAACLVAALGLVVFAVAPDPRFAIAGVVLATGAAHPGSVVRAMTEIWVNRRTASDVRTTTHSLLSLTEQTGEVLVGASLAVLAAGSPTWSFAGCAVLVAIAAMLVAATGRRRR